MKNKKNSKSTTHRLKALSVPKHKCSGPSYVFNIGYHSNIVLLKESLLHDIEKSGFRLNNAVDVVADVRWFRNTSGSLKTRL